MTHRKREWDREIERERERERDANMHVRACARACMCVGACRTCLHVHAHTQTRARAHQVCATSARADEKVREAKAAGPETGTAARAAAVGVQACKDLFPTTFSGMPTANAEGLDRVGG